MTNKGSDIKIIKKLGEGSFADVFLGKSTQTGEMFAIKRLKKRYRTVDEVNHLPEIYSLRTLQGHPNIIKLLNISYDGSNGYVSLFFELMELNLYELIMDHKKPFDENTALILVYQILKGIAFVHSKNLFHRDIKPENCMVDKKTMVLKLCDFGSTRSESNASPYTEYISTRWYRAPECILTSGSYGSKVDEWAVGCILYELMTGLPLFPGKHEIDQIGRIHNIIGTPPRRLIDEFKRNPNPQIMNMNFKRIHPKDFQKILPSANKETIQLLKGLLTYDPKERVSAAEALEMPAFAFIRRMENEWYNMNKPGNFPTYFLEHQTVQPNQLYSFTSNQSNSTNQNNQNQIDNNFKGIFYDNNKNDNNYYNSSDNSMNNSGNYGNGSYGMKQNGESSVNKVYQSPGAVIINHRFPEPKPTVYQTMHYHPPKSNLFISQKQPQLKSGKFAQTQKLAPTYQSYIGSKNALDPELIEARMRAAQRIIEYNKKAKYPRPNLPLKVNPVTKKYEIGHNKINAGFQKPRLDLVQPRLPKIVI
ncbi:putative long flagella protein lf4 [Tritrichomonas foetus]|uniref:Long flagella protein lf4 n=1 Tax=Tritrichomonas foetus TaxID=1144522 RepID=A0A1J4KRF4_9EUKA|nr:putative long flagella protein lf4 [Tritrichomonas foetus]|eukprot:OHT13674.1 putative long flagella protein lf4 [Tritrichomonas foetus]